MGVTVVDLLGTGPGRDGFIERHGLWDDAEYAAAAQALRVIDEHGIELVRVVFPDPHGTPRGKTLTREAFATALRDGVGAPSTLVLKDTSGRTVFPVFDPAGSPVAAMAGASDLVLVPLPTTFRVLPWAERTAWVLCDIQRPDGAPVPFSARHVLRDRLHELAGRGLELRVGLEVEFHAFRRTAERACDGGPGEPGQPPDVAPVSTGAQLLSEASADAADEIVQLLRNGLVALDLPLRSIEVEFGPSQFEITFGPQDALRAADDLVLCRSAVKQLCARRGYHATFMARPHLPGVMSSGWHLHQCLCDRETGGNRFAAHPGDEGALSALAQGYLAGLLAHAPAASVFTTPTVNGYKRYRPHSLAPDRAVWGTDNRGAMIRAVGGPGDPATRLENRSGEPAANPYLSIAAQLVSGLDGIDRGLDPGSPTIRPYDDAASRLPASLMDAVAALGADPLFAQRFGDTFVDYFVALKQAEIDRYLAAVTDWEHREYFDLY
ncbi:MAG TPA: glutamine synthetase family protein [Pseudonocardia sp.]|nr:glutamine synthetase family protein [Pseudonocardia sp.]